MQFCNSFGTKSIVEAAMEPHGTLNLNGLNGGRDRTRTCDLLRVKQHLHSGRPASCRMVSICNPSTGRWTETISQMRLRFIPR